jgi:HEAT repeat protein
LALSRLGGDASRFAPRIAMLLRDSDKSVRIRAIDSLAILGKEGAKFAPEIVSRLSDTDWQVRLHAVTASAGLNQFEHGLVEAVRKAQFDENAVVQQEALRVLPYMQRKESVPVGERR